MQPDIHCKICGGRGYTYTYQKTMTVYQLVMLRDSSGILQVDSEYEDCNLLEVYDFSGRRYSNAEKFGVYVQLNTTDLPNRGVYFTIVMVKEIEKKIGIVQTIKSNLGYYTIPGLTSSKTNIDGVYYDASGDIVSIDKIIDAAGIEYQPKEYRLNQFRIEPTTETVEGETVIIPITEPVVCL